MAIWMMNPATGSDASAGNSWSVPWQTLTSGATSARVAAGDTIRIAKTPDPVDTGLTATWTSGIYHSNYWKGTGVQAISSSTNANPVVVTATGHTLVTGDFVGITGHNANTNANGVWQITVLTANTFSIPVAGNGTGTGTGSIFKITSQMVVLSSPVTSVISNCDTIWTAGTSCVPTVSNMTSSAKEGTASAKLTITTPATSTKLAYVLTANANYAAYNQISFWIMNSTVINAGQYTLNLCSDTAGATVVNQVAIPAVPSTGQYVAFTVDTGAALGSSIQSVALYTGATTGTSNVLNVDHIIACGPSGNASSLTLNSLIGCNDGNQGWFHIRTINGNVIGLDHMINSNWQNARGYYGPTTTAELWRRETFKQPMMAGNQNTSNNLSTNNNVNRSGTSSAMVTISGGWNTATGLQDGDTYWDGQNGFGTGMGGQVFGSISYVAFSRLNMSKFYNAFGVYDGYPSWLNCTFNIFNVTCCSYVFCSPFNTCTLTFNNVSFMNQGIMWNTFGGGNNNTVTLYNMFAMYIWGVSMGNTYQTLNVVNYIASVGANNASGSGAIYINGALNSIVGTGGNTVITGFNGSSSQTPSSSAAIYCSSATNCTIKNLLLSSNTNDFMMVNNLNTSFIDGTYSVTPYMSGSSDERFYMRNPNGVTQAKVFGDNMTCQTDLATVHTAGNRSWNIATSRTSVAYPATLSLGYVTLGGNVINTISAWVYYTSAGMTAGIQVVGNQIEGMVTTQQATSTGTINTWIQLTLTITAATQSGPVMLQAYGLSSSGTQNMWIADISVT